MSSSISAVKLPIPGRFAKTIVVNVGGEGDFTMQNFVVHQAHICYFSEFFQAACGKNWRPSETAEISLPHDDPAIFEHFLDFIYRQELESYTQREKPKVRQSLKSLIRLYILSEKVQVAKLKNAVIDAIATLVKATSYVPGEDMVREAYENTTHGSPLRELLVDLWAWGHVLASQDFSLTGGNLSESEFLMDLATLQTERLFNGCPVAPYEISLCTYHEHSTNFPCSNGK